MKSQCQRLLSFVFLGTIASIIAPVTAVAGLFDAFVCPGAQLAMIVDDPSGFTAMDVRGETLVTLDSYGMSKWVVDESEKPVRVGSWMMPRGESWSVFGAQVLIRDDGFVMVYQSSDGIMVFDIRDDVPELVWQSTSDFINPFFESATKGVSLSQDVVVIKNSYGLAFFDFSDPLQPARVDTVWPGSAPTTVDVAYANDLLVISGFFTIMVWDVSDLTHPALLSTLDPNSEVGFSMLGWEVVASDSMAIFVMGLKASYDFGQFGVVTMDLSDPYHPELFDVHPQLPWNFVSTLELDGNMVAAAANRFSAPLTLEIVEFSAPDIPNLVQSAEPPEGAWAFTVGSPHSAVLDRTRVDLLNANLQTIGRTPNGGQGETVKISGTVAVQAHGTGGLLVYDLSDPTSPVLTGRLELDGYMEDVAFDGTMAYAADDKASSVRVVDVSDPWAPRLRSMVPTLGAAYDVAVSGSTVVVSNSGRSGAEAAQVIDASDPDAPVIASTITTGNLVDGISGVAIAGQYAYYVTGHDLHVIDISDPYQAFIVASLTVVLNPASAEEAHDIAINGTTAYIATEYEGTVLVDISDPTQPSLMTVHPDLKSHHVETDGARSALVWAPHQIVDFENPLQPEGRSFRPIRGNWGHAFLGEFLLVPSGPFFEVFSLDCSAPEAVFDFSTSGLQIWPRDESRKWVSERLWDFGDGTTGNDRNPFHEYEVPGDYVLTLTVSNEFGQDTATAVVHVRSHAFFSDGFESGDSSAWSGISTGG